MQYQSYLSQVRERLAGLGFADVAIPSDLAGPLGLAMERLEAWGNLMIALPAGPATGEPGPREALARSAAAWVRNLQQREDDRRYLILVFPFEKKVSEATGEAVKALRQEDGAQRWGLVAWPADLEVELIDRPPGFPKVDDKVARALTEVPRGAVEGFLRTATEPKIGGGRLRVDMGYVPATRIIFAATVAYYIWVLLITGQGLRFLQGPSGSALVLWGANKGELVLLAGQHWRLLTHVLLHGGLLHLGLNMWALWSLGRHTELVYGTWRMVYIYICAGVAGGVASTVFRFVPTTSVGASGAVLGLLGALCYFAFAMPGRVDWRAFMGPVVINLLYGFVMPGIDNHAHIGGFIGGFAAAFLVGIAGQRRPWRLAGVMVGGVVVAVILSGLVPLPHLGLF